MSFDFQIFICSDAYAGLQQVGKFKASHLMWWIGTLRTAPSNRSDYTEKDPAGRDIEIKVISRFAIYYWIDQAARSEGSPDSPRGPYSYAVIVSSEQPSLASVGVSQFGRAITPA